MAPTADYLEALYEALGRVGVHRTQCDFDEARGIMLMNVGKGADGSTRVVPVVSLAAQYAACPSETVQTELLAAAAEAFGQGAADVPREFEACGTNLLPQLWAVEKIAATRMSLAEVDELPTCGLHGESLSLMQGAARDGPLLGVVLVFDFVRSAAGGSLSLPVETPVLVSDLRRWGVSFTEALQRALDNLRSRTKSGPPPEKRWEHHPSGCGQSSWCDRFDAARAALLPALIAKRKRPDGQPEAGGHVVAFATPSCVLATTSKNALGLCFLGDTLHTKIAAPGSRAGPSTHQLLSTTPYRLLKMKDSSGASEGEVRHPLNQKAGEGLLWRWLPYSPGGPPLRAAGEFSVPVDSDEVDAILNAAEAGRPVPVFRGGEAGGASASAAPTFAQKKEVANALFKAGEYVKAIAAYDAALNVMPPPSDAEAAVAHANAAQALLKLAERDEPRRGPIAAEALRRAARAGELDPGYAKAHARCATACDILGESDAAAEFRVRAAACSGEGAIVGSNGVAAGKADAVVPKTTALKGGGPTSAGVAAAELEALQHQKEEAHAEKREA